MTIELSKETEQYLEAYLIEQGLQKDAMSNVVEEALEDFLFKRMLDSAAKRNADLDLQAAESLIQEVIKEDRQNQRNNQTKN